MGWPLVLQMRTNERIKTKHKKLNFFVPFWGWWDLVAFHRNKVSFSGLQSLLQNAEAGPGDHDEDFEKTRFKLSTPRQSVSAY
jgi:hypothetical protein